MAPRGEPRRFLLETSQDRAAVQPEMLGIGEDKTHRIGGTGEAIGPSGLERRKVARLDPQCCGDIDEIETADSSVDAASRLSIVVRPTLRHCSQAIG